MEPYETKSLQRTFDTIGLSDTKLIDMIKDWLSDAIADTHFNDYDYTIMVGSELFNHGISQIFDDPMSRLSYILDRSRIKLQICVDPLLYYRIKIEWRAPVYREDDVRIGNIHNEIDRLDGLRYSKVYIDKYFDAYKNVNRLPQIKKVIYNNPATIIFWADGTKTVVQCQPEDEYDPEKGLALAIAKKALGNTSRKLNDVLHKWEKIVRGCENCKYYSEPIYSKSCSHCLQDLSHPNWEEKNNG